MHQSRDEVPPTNRSFPFFVLMYLQIPASEGGIFFLPANTYCTMVSGKTSDLRIAMAHTNLNWGPVTPRGGTGAPNF